MRITLQKKERLPELDQSKVLLSYQFVSRDWVSIKGWRIGQKVGTFVSSEEKLTNPKKKREKEAQVELVMAIRKTE